MTENSLLAVRKFAAVPLLGSTLAACGRKAPLLVILAVLFGAASSIAFPLSQWLSYPLPGIVSLALLYVLSTSYQIMILRAASNQSTDWMLLFEHATRFFSYAIADIMFVITLAVCACPMLFPLMLIYVGAWPANFANPLFCGTLAAVLLITAIPAIYVGTRYSLYRYCIAAEDCVPIAAFGRSWRLSEGRFIPLLGAYAAAAPGVAAINLGILSVALARFIMSVTIIEGPPLPQVLLWWGPYWGLLFPALLCLNTSVLLMLQGKMYTALAAMNPASLNRASLTDDADSDAEAEEAWATIPSPSLEECPQINADD